MSRDEDLTDPIVRSLKEILTTTLDTTKAQVISRTTITLVT
jgi:hypothetical protein